jgi:DNA-binding response OmpR family regulator
MSKKKVLVVDDEPSIVRLIQVKLVKEGFEVLTAFNGEEALEKARSEKPDLILLDVMMPKMSGHTVCAELKKDTVLKTIPVIMLTAVGEFEQQLKGLQLGAAEYLTKPFNPKQLVELVRYLLEKGRTPDFVRQKERKERRLKTIVEIMRQEKK